MNILFVTTSIKHILHFIDRVLYEMTTRGKIRSHPVIHNMRIKCQSLTFNHVPLNMSYTEGYEQNLSMGGLEQLNVI